MSNTYGILEWTNEHSLNSYPLSKAVAPLDFLVDAAFVQFDGFVPVLKQITVEQNRLTLVVTTDAGDIQVVVARPNSRIYASGYTVRLASSAGRHLGHLVFGLGLVSIFNTRLNDVVKLNIPFHASCVRGVNSRAGVYSIEKLTGAVEVSTGQTLAEQTLFFSTEANEVTWNAGYLPPAVTSTPLKTLNGVHPVNNAVFIEDSELIKATPQAAGVLLELGVPIGYDSISPATTYK